MWRAVPIPDIFPQILESNSYYYIFLRRPLKAGLTILTKNYIALVINYLNFG